MGTTNHIHYPDFLWRHSRGSRAAETSGVQGPISSKFKNVGRYRIQYIYNTWMRLHGPINLRDCRTPLLNNYIKNPSILQWSTPSHSSFVKALTSKMKAVLSDYKNVTINVNQIRKQSPPFYVSIRMAVSSLASCGVLDYRVVCGSMVASLISLFCLIIGSSMLHSTL